MDPVFAKVYSENWSEEYNEVSQQSMFTDNDGSADFQVRPPSSFLPSFVWKVLALIALIVLVGVIAMYVLLAIQENHTNYSTGFDLSPEIWWKRTINGIQTFWESTDIGKFSKQANR